MPDQVPPVPRRAPTLKRVKNEVSRLRTANPALKQHEALDEVARRRGFANYKALHRASHDEHPINTYLVRFEAAWHDRAAQALGQVVVEVQLTGAWDEFLTLAQRRATGGLKAFRIDGHDRSHLISTEPMATQENALHAAAKAARTLAFIDVMRFVPATWSIASGALGAALDSRAPALDHERAWHDPQSGAFFISSEPYSDRLQRHMGQQAEWLSANNLEAITIAEGSMHNPPGTVLQLFGRADQPTVLQNAKTRAARLARAYRAVRLLEPSAA